MDNFSTKNPKKFPVFAVSALRGGSGKTIASLGIIRALRDKGLKIAAFKKGPDYIDAAWLAAASGRPCYNLDQYLMDETTIRDSFTLRSNGCDAAVVEGNRGLFDGLDISGTSSTARLCKSLHAPVLLVVDCTKSTRTVAAMVLGCLNFDPDLEFLGVILNQVAGPRHTNIVTKSIEAYTGLPVLGYIPRLKNDPLPMRHLGLTPADEFDGLSKALDRLAAIAREHFNLNEILSLSAKKTRPKRNRPDLRSLFGVAHNQPYTGLKIGIIKDASFQFYYPENLEVLELLGAELIYLNALLDKTVPAIDGLYLGGGFPETQAERLQANKAFRNKLFHLIEQGLPVYAECGGLMYLGEEIRWQGKNFQMVGALPLCFEMKKKPAGHGYTKISFLHDSPFYKEGTVVKGHEFHYSKPVLPNNRRYETYEFTCEVLRGSGFGQKKEGLVTGNAFCTYTHIHALGQKEWACTFLKGVATCKRNRKWRL